MLSKLATPSSASSSLSEKSDGPPQLERYDAHDFSTPTDSSPSQQLFQRSVAKMSPSRRTKEQINMVAHMKKLEAERDEEAKKDWVFRSSEIKYTDPPTGESTGKLVGKGKGIGKGRSNNRSK